MLDLFFLIGVYVLVSGSRQFVGTELLKLFSKAFHRKIALYIYSLIFLPGTIFHELSHFITAILLRVRVGKISVLPKINPTTDEIQLGSVHISRSDFVRTSLIGAAPTIFGIIAIHFILNYFVQTTQTISKPGLTTLFTDNFIHQLTPLNILGTYLIFVLASTLQTSKRDRQAWPFLALFLTATYVILSLSQFHFSWLLSFNLAQQVIKLTTAALFFTLFINLFVFLVLKILNYIIYSFIWNSNSICEITRQVHTSHTPTGGSSQTTLAMLKSLPRRSIKNSTSTAQPSANYL